MSKILRGECAMCGKPTDIKIECEAVVLGTEPNIIKLPVMVPLHTCTGCGFEFTDDIAETARDETVKIFRETMRQLKKFMVDA